MPVKFAGALIAAGSSFLLMAVAATLAEHGPVGPHWLLLVYLLYSCGEIALAPAGLALAAAVAPPGSTSRLLAVNGLFGAVGVVVGGQLFRLTTVLSPATYFLCSAPSYWQSAQPSPSAPRACAHSPPSGGTPAPEPRKPHRDPTRTADQVPDVFSNCRGGGI